MADGKPTYIEPDLGKEMPPQVKGSRAIKEYLKKKEKELEKEIISKKEAAKRLGVSATTISNRLISGKLKGDGKGGVAAESVDALLDAEKCNYPEPDTPVDEPATQVTKQKVVDLETYEILKERYDLLYAAYRELTEELEDTKKQMEEARTPKLPEFTVVNPYVPELPDGVEA